MKDAYAKGNADGWNFRSQRYYLSTIFNAGRAYSLQYPTDPDYAVLATLTVAIGSGLHYNPLTNHDGAVWWVREAADWVAKHSEDTATHRAGAGAARARQLRRRIPSSSRAMPTPTRRPTFKPIPATATRCSSRSTPNWRGWLLTRDPQWRSLALSARRSRRFPIAHLPTTWGNEFVAAARARRRVATATPIARRRERADVSRRG